MKKVLKVSIALALAGAAPAHAAIGFKAGEWDLSFSGNVNGFATWNSCDNSDTVVAGGLACSRPANGGLNESRIESGLLPSALVFSGKSRQAGLDVSVTIGFYPGLNSTARGGKQGLDTNTIDLRQNFLTFGNPAWGTVKVGKDIGLFASDAILSDMTLFGVGSGAAFFGGNTSLGRIGIGYIYADWIPQISYKSPDFAGGFSVSAGIFDTVNATPFSGLPTSAQMTGHERPAFQARGAYEWKGRVGGKVWVSGIEQRIKARTTDTAPAGSSISGRGIDIGTKLTFEALEGVLYYYDARGLGTTALGFDAVSLSGGGIARRKSKGGYAQATYKIGPWKPGVSYGISKLDLADNESSGTNPTLVKENKSYVLGLYYSLTESLTLTGEFVRTEAENQANGKVKDKAVIAGAILMF